MAEVLSTYALCAVADVKEFVQITASTWDNIITRMINAATFAIENNFTNGRRFKERTAQVEYYDGNGQSGNLYVLHYPVNAVNSLYDDTVRDFGASTLIASSDYVIVSDKDRGVIRLLNGLVFAKGIQNIKLDYDYGWSTVPEEVRDVAIEIVARKYLDYKDKAISRTAERFGDGSVTFSSKDLLPFHREVLESYKVVGTSAA